MSAAGKLQGQVAIVTGGSSGIGRATSLALAAEGAHLVIVGRNSERLAQTTHLIQEKTGRSCQTLALSLDVKREADMEEMAARTLTEFGRIDILVCSAGVLRAAGAPLKPAAQLPLAWWDEVLAINLTGVFLSNRAVLPTMLQQQSGNIVNLSSIAGRSGMPFDAPYCVSKFGVIGLSEVLAEEVRSEGVRVQVLLPGPFETEMLQKRWTGAMPPQPGDFPPPSRVADMIVHLITMPADTRLVMPIIEPLRGEASSGWRGGRQPARPGRSPAAGPRPPQSKDDLKENLMTQTSAERSLAGKTIIVTGGTGGIGLATCRAAARAGASVVVADVNADRIAAAVQELTSLANPQAGHLGIPVDIRREPDNQKMAQAALGRFGRIDGLVACAGVLRKRGTAPKPLVKTTIEEWDEVLDINLKGVFLSNQAVLPAMIKQRSGVIINISSVSGLEGRAHDGPYCASKFGVIGLTQSVADEVRTYGVKVQALMPDAIATPIWEQNHPVPPPGDALPPERVADVIVFMLAQPEDTTLLGAVIAPLGARRRKEGAKATSRPERPPGE
jgi:NAD(P)-dependent dehydrogenase (short-subunit alcohol dehydrogenase family)